LGKKKKEKEWEGRVCRNCWSGKVSAMRGITKRERNWNQGERESNRQNARRKRRGRWNGEMKIREQLKEFVRRRLQ
jgi:hypothetical protein